MEYIRPGSSVPGFVKFIFIVFPKHKRKGTSILSEEIIMARISTKLVLGSHLKKYIYLISLENEVIVYIFLQKYLS